MADPIAIADDVDMEAGGEPENSGRQELEGQNGDDAVAPLIPRPMFLDYLQSPIVELVVGVEPNRTVLSVHQDLLTKSPWFERACAEALSLNQLRIELPDEDLTAMGSFLEFLYMGEYFPRRIEGKAMTLEEDPSIPVPDYSGEQLLKHARVYGLGEKFQLPDLKTLAHSKVQATTSTARGEIAYARYIYGSTADDDSLARKPIAAFWAQRSHVLRHEVEEEFRAMCIQYPQFAFDVLSQLLDAKEQRKGPAETSITIDTPGTSKGKKRSRISEI